MARIIKHLLPESTFESIKNGECFLDDNELMMKVDDNGERTLHYSQDEDYAVSLETGLIYSLGYNHRVIPVDVDIHVSCLNS